MNDYETMYLDNYLLPNYGKLVEKTQPNVAKNYTLDGTLFVDYYANRRTWVISWELLTIGEQELLQAKYNLQFSQQQMLTFAVPSLGISVPVYINVDDKSIVYNGQYVEGFSITLEEQFAIS